MILSLVTGTRNRPQDFLRLAESIRVHTDVEWELVASDASDIQMSLDMPPNVRILPERPRLGCTRGYNRAFREAVGEWVIWLNDDCEVLPGYASAAIRFMESNPSIGLGALHYSENGGDFHVNSAWGATYANFGILRRELGNQVGWFDEDIEMYGNDNSLTIRVLLAGKGVADIPEARVLHHSTQDDCRRENQAARMKDNLTLQRKYLSIRHEWLPTFRRFAMPGNEEAWAHGVAPPAVQHVPARRRRR